MESIQQKSTLSRSLGKHSIINIIAKYSTLLYYTHKTHKYQWQWFSENQADLFDKKIVVQYFDNISQHPK